MKFQKRTAHWAAVFSLFMGVTSLITAEFIPVSLLTPIAGDLNITEGMAGQTVTAVGIFAVLTSLLVPTKDVPRALSIVYAGVSVATILSLPLASYFGELIGWRNVFLLGSGMGAITFVWQFMTLPALPAQRTNSFGNMFALIRKYWVLAEIGGTIFSYGGYHVFFTYLRPFLEYNLSLSAETLSVTLLIFGIANCIGTFFAGAILGKYFRLTMYAVPLALAGTAVLLLLSGQGVSSLMLTVVWGFIFGFIPVGWSTWIARTLADKAELAGGLSVAAIQFSIGLAAAIGGMTFDTFGMNGIFIIAAAFLCFAFILVKISFSLYMAVTGQRL